MGRSKIEISKEALPDLSKIKKIRQENGYLENPKNIFRIGKSSDHWN